MNTLLDVTPNSEIKFELVAGKTLERNLKLRNKTDLPVAFKVKTTAPKRYCVRPNCSIIKAKDAVEVKIVMQPLKDLPSPPNQWKDKFLIQAGQLSEVPAENSGDPKVLFDGLTREALHEQKLMCTFELPAEASSVAHTQAPAVTPEAEDSKAPPAPAPVSASDNSSAPKTSREKDLEEKLNLERRLADKLAREVEAGRDRERGLKEAIEEEREQNKEVVRALELLQGKFEALQTKHQKSGAGDKKGGEVAVKESPMRNYIMAFLVIVIAILIAKIALPQ